jgi:hypothetical protein
VTSFGGVVELSINAESDAEANDSGSSVKDTADDDEDDVMEAASREWRDGDEGKNPKDDLEGDVDKTEENELKESRLRTMDDRDLRREPDVVDGDCDCGRSMDPRG